MKHFIFIFFLGFHLTALSQSSEQGLERIKENIKLKHKTGSSLNLFLHCDKTIYTNNETIWFAAYLTDKRGGNILQHNTLSVALINDDKSKGVYLSEQYLMKDGLSSGSIDLPDSIPPGSYNLVGYTNILNKNGEPKAIFYQPITISTTLVQELSASINLVPKKTPDEPIYYAIKIQGIQKKNNRFPPVSVKFNLAGKETLIKTNEQGEGLITIPSEQIGPGRQVLYAEARYKYDVQNYSMTLPDLTPEKVTLKFYPEGGYLSDGLSSLIGFEALSSTGSPVSLKAVVFCDDKGVDTIETNSYGFGRFYIRPLSGRRYYCKPLDEQYKNQVFELPEIKNSNPILTIKNAIVQDTLNFMLKSPNLNPYLVVVHNEQEIFSNFKISSNSSGRSVKIIIKDLSKGLNSVSVMDTLGNPLAERLFFAHYNENDLVSAETDKSIYKVREQVKLKIRLDDIKSALGPDSIATVSVACVQLNRLESNKSQDFQSYRYIQQELDNLTLIQPGLVFRDKEELENILLIKGWRRYTSSQSPKNMEYPSQETIPPLFTGTITRFGKPVDKGMGLTLMRDTLVNLIMTDKSGRFELQEDEINAVNHKPLYFFINDKNRTTFDLKFDNPYDHIDKALAHKPYPDLVYLGQKKQLDTTLSRIDNKTIRLKEVQIGSSRSSNIYGGRVMNKCGDYVCHNNYLNCLGHMLDPSNSLPIKGKTYRTSYRSHNGVLLEGRSVIYEGCIKELPKYIAIKGKMLAKEFYINDYSSPEFNSPQYLSTIFWSPMVKLQKGKEVEIFFYTSDIKYDYQISIQGLFGQTPVSFILPLKIDK